MEYKDMVKKTAKMCEYYAHCNSPEICPLQGAAHECKANHSPQFFVLEPKLLDEVERIVTEWKKPVDWEAVAERAKTEDIKVLVWDDDKTRSYKRYFYSYDPDNTDSPFIAVDSGRTRWTSNDVTGWQHAELVEEDE